MNLNNLKRFYRNKFISLPVLFFIILFCKNLLISEFAVNVPFGDQWDGELMNLYKPYEEGNLSVSHFFAPHNEHRILFTRLFNLGIYILNGNRWSPLLVIRVQSILASLIPVLLLFFFYRLKPIPFLIYIFFGIFSSLPLLYENLLSGFQNQFYFMLIFTILGIGTFSVKMKNEFLKLTMLIILSTFAYFSMASGFILPLVLAFLYFHYYFYSKRLKYLCVAIFLLTLGVLLLLTTPKLEKTELDYNVKTLKSFVSILYKIFQLPNISGFNFGFCMIWIPILLLLYRNVWKNKYSAIPRKPFFFGLLILLLIQIAGIAYARGNQPITLKANRYYDIFYLPIYCLIHLYAFNGYNLKKSISIKFIHLGLLLFLFVYLSIETIQLLRIEKYTGRRKLAIDNYYQYFIEESKDKDGAKKFIYGKAPEFDYWVFPWKIPLIRFLEDPTAREILRKSGLDKR
jgi:hypothetical protein